MADDPWVTHSYVGGKYFIMFSHFIKKNLIEITVVFIIICVSQMFFSGIIITYKCMQLSRAVSVRLCAPNFSLLVDVAKWMSDCMN